MFTITNSIRRAIPVLVASLGFAVATGPIVAAAQARPNDGAYKKSSEARKKSFSGGECQYWKDEANRDSDKAYEAYQNGDNATGDRYQESADQAFQIAKAGGCAWAIWRLQNPSSRYGHAATSRSARG